MNLIKKHTAAVVVVAWRVVRRLSSLPPRRRGKRDDYDDRGRHWGGWWWLMIMMICVRWWVGVLYVFTGWCRWLWWWRWHIMNDDGVVDDVRWWWLGEILALGMICGLGVWAVDDQGDAWYGGLCGNADYDDERLDKIMGLLWYGGVGSEWWRRCGVLGIFD